MLAAAPAYTDPVSDGSPGTGRFDPFRALGDAERAREISAYHTHLEELDGEIDWERWSLPKRDERLKQILAEPILWDGKIDRDGFYQHFHRVGTPEVDIRTHWAILAAVANESERYGVELEIADLKPRGPDADPVKVYHVLQENHHTALLLETCRMLGLEGVRLLDPRRFHGWIIKAMAILPDSLRYALILVGEAIGAVVFQLLHDTCHLFGDDPAMEARLRSMMAEIVADERLHVVHCRSRLGPWALGAARAVVPMAARFSVLAYPQIARLGLDHRQLAREIRRGIEVPAAAPWVEADQSLAVTPA